MSKVFRTIGTVAGVLSTALMFVPGAQPIALGLKAAQLAQITAAVAVAAGIGAQLTANKPRAEGQINQRLIGANNPQPYLIGRSYSGGVQLHDAAWGGEVDGVKNPYRFIAAEHSCCGPVEELESVLADFEAVTFSGTAASGYYADWLWRDYQLGARPEADALAPNWAGCPEWGTDYKLSGHAAIGYSLKWAKKGQRYAGGRIPVLGAVWKGVKVYDPRLDSTYPGGSGSHRLTDESTWAYSRSPALHALAYAYGRYVNGVKVFGVDLGAAAIDLGDVVAWANLCDTNSWYVDGTIFEPGDKWNNLKRICEAGGAEPVLRGGVLGFDWQAPRVSLATITKDDLADGPLTAKALRGWKERVNTIVPKFRSEGHQWSYQQCSAQSVAAFVTADGEVKTEERQWDLVTGVSQVAQLATYDLWQRREAGPIVFTGKAHLRGYDPGDCLTLAAELGAHPDGAVKCVLRKRGVDPAAATVRLELEADSDAKHTAALAATGTAPDTTNLPTGQDLDEAWYYNGLPPPSVSWDSSAITFDSSLVTMDAS